MKPVTIAIIGAGGRGQGYARYTQTHPGEGKIVAVAEPVAVRREKMASDYGLARENVFSDWKDLAAKPRLADCVIIGTQDRMHTEPAIAFAKKGYHMILEKPMAPTAAECVDIVKAAKAAGIVFAVGHVLRYTSFYNRMKELIDGGAVGEVVTVQHLEPVAYWHQAHSFVRGHWRNSKESSFMLLAKSCHDLDIMSYLVGKPCKAVSSFGSLRHFRKDQKPAGAGSRCFDCAIERECPYSAVKIYLEGRNPDWVRHAVSDEHTLDAVRKGLETGPYGRCVYECDNDVVDHQVVSFQYDDEVTAVFTMTAFTMHGGRETRIMGTMGELIGNREAGIIHNDFRSGYTTTHELARGASGGHGGGDEGLMRSFLAAVSAKDPSLIASGPDASLESHLAVFAAEEARLKGTVEKIADYM